MMVPPPGARPVVEDRAPAATGVVAPSAWLTLSALIFFNILNYVDRNILSILMQPIKADLRLSDTQLGLLTGFAFSAFFAIAGLPLAAWADRGVRRNIAALCITLWSAMTILCGQARNFTTFFAARTLVGVGEAGVTPVAYSMIGDLFPRERRSSALAIYSIGASVGLVGGYAIGGYLEPLVGWRATLAVVGAPGLLFALWMRLFLREPVRGATDPTWKPADRRSSYLALVKQPAFAWLLVGTALFSITALNGIDQWLPAYFERQLGLQRTQIGGMMAMSSGVGSVIGVVCGGFLGDLIGRRGLGGLIIFGVSILVATVPLKLLLFVSHSPAEITVLLFLGSLIGAFASGPMLAYMQSIIDPTQRASAAAANLLVTALVAWGGGPFLVGVLSDLLAPRYGVQSLGISLFALHLIGLVAPVFLLLSLRAWRRSQQ